MRFGTRIIPAARVYSARRHTRAIGNNWPVSVVAFIVALASTLVLAAVVGWLFYWAAREDGRQDDAVQRRLGIRRRTRLGPD